MKEFKDQIHDEPRACTFIEMRDNISMEVRHGILHTDPIFYLVSKIRS